MKKAAMQLWGAVALIGLACLSWLVVAGLLLWAVLDPTDWSTVTGALGGRAGLLIFLWALALIPVHATLAWLIERHVRAPARLAEQARIRLEGELDKPIAASGSEQNEQLTSIINQLLAERISLRQEMDQRVNEAARRTEQEKARLAALMSELTKSVVVCNLDGRILLYNKRARQQFKRLSQSARLTGGGELIGLGRSIYVALDRERIGHALENVQRRLERDAAHPAAQFVTTTSSGKLLRVQMTPVCAVDQDGSPCQREMTGFVLLIENITAEMQAGAEKDELLGQLTEGSRAGLANARAAIEVLEDPALDDALRERLTGVIREEVQAMSERIERLQQSASRAMKSRWPLEDMLAADLVDAAINRIQSALEIKATREGEIENLWLKVDSYSLIQALVHLAGKLQRECGVLNLGLRLGQRNQRARLDLVWTPPADSQVEAGSAWETEPLQLGDQTLALNLRDILERHGGECWIEQEVSETGPRSFFRLLLPLAAPAEELPSASLQRFESRPEFYDFDLFGRDGRDRSLDDCPLRELSLTVFDTETTGLNPAGGDEILQIGAVRIVNGKIVAGESFDQLVDPQRKIPAASIPFHGITPDMVAGQPTIDEVLPAFHAWCKDTVLVAHNAAFDMKCLEMKQTRAGVLFDQPVLDTLLLSVLVHENQERHNLDDIAERFGLTILGRHTAIGDAMVTAEIFVRLIPLLAEKGIHTLGQALEAARKTWAARIKY